MKNKTTIPLNKLVESLLDSYEDYPIIRNVDSTNRINRVMVLEILEKDLSMRQKLFENTRHFAEKIKQIGLDIIDKGAPIIPIMLYDEHIAVEMAKRMIEKGVYVVAFSYPVVPKGKARIRTQLSAALSEEDILYIVECFRQVKKEMGI